MRRRCSDAAALHCAVNVYCDNVIFSLQAAGGISVYWSELLRRLIGSEHTLTVIERPSARNNVMRQDITFPADTTLVYEHGPAQLARLRKVNAPMTPGSIFHSSYYRTTAHKHVARVVTVYDFTYEHFRRGPPRWLHRLEKSRSLSAADGIICISESTRRDLTRFYPGVDAAKVRVIPMGISDGYRPIDNSRELPGWLRHTPGERYVLYVGDRRQYKNFSLAVRALSRLPRYSLVTVGGGPFTASESRQLDALLPGRYRHLGALDTESLNAAYNHAHCLIYPSRYEGFGIPVLEAMQAGCPAVVAANSALIETSGSAGILVASDTPQDWAEAILKLEDGDARRQRITQGLWHAQNYTWQHCYEKTVAFYRELLALKFGYERPA